MRILKGVQGIHFAATSSWGPLDAKTEAALRGVEASKSWSVSAGIIDKTIGVRHGNTISCWLFRNIESVAKGKGIKFLVAETGVHKPDVKLLKRLGFKQAGKTEYFVKAI